MKTREQASKIAKDYAVAKLMETATLDVLRVLDDSDEHVNEIQFDDDEPPQNCWYVVSDADITGLASEMERAAVCRQRIICVARDFETILLDTDIDIDLY